MLSQIEHMLGQTQSIWVVDGLYIQENVESMHSPL